MENLAGKANLFVINQNNLKTILGEEKFLTNNMEKNKIIGYLRSFKPSWITSAKVKDNITNTKLQISDNSYNDGVYQWSESDIYQIEKYNAPLNSDFVDYLTEKIEI